MEKKLIQNYRGMREATLIAIKEGDGTEEHPAQIVEYVICDGMTVGKVQNLSEEERSWFRAG